MPQENLNIVRKLFDIHNKNDASKLNAIDELIAPSAQFHDPSMTKANLQAFKQAEMEYIKAFPNKKTKIDNIVAAEDQVIVRWTSTGTHKGNFHGNAPSNKEFKISGISIYKLSNNKIAEVWQIWDRLGLLEQLGEVRQMMGAASHR